MDAMFPVPKNAVIIKNTWRKGEVKVMPNVRINQVDFFCPIVHFKHKKLLYYIFNVI